MLNVGAGELTLILVVALLVLGPSRLPELARGIGKFLREFRSRTDEVRHVVEREFYRMDAEVQALPPPKLGGQEGAPRSVVAPNPAATPAPLEAISEGTLLPQPETIPVSFGVMAAPADAVSEGSLLPPPGSMPAPKAADPVSPVPAGPLDPSVARTQSQPPMTQQEAQRLIDGAQLPAKGDGQP